MNFWLRPAASQVIDWTPEGRSRRWDRPQRTWQHTCGKIYEKWLSVTVTVMKPGALPVIVLNGDNSSPSVPAGTGRPKSKAVLPC